jgi:hypothetical protein
VTYELLLVIALNTQAIAGCDAAAQRGWAEFCLSTTRPNGERRTPAWSNSDVWLDGNFLQQYASHCRASVPAQEAARASSDSDPLRQFYRRHAEAASRCSLEQHLDWQETCWRAATAIKPGQTRAELLRDFRTEGGISVPAVRRFVHRQCDMLHITVHFRLENAKDMSEQAADVITKIEGPYLAPYFAG